MATYKQQMKKIVEAYRLADQPWPASAKAIAEWAIRSGLWELPPEAVRSNHPA